LCHGIVPHAEPGDVRRRDDVAGLVERAVSAFGRLDVMVANAAISTYIPFEQMTEQEIDDMLDIDLRGALLCAQLAIAPMRDRGGGSIVFVSSVQAFVTLPGSTPYAAAKAGLVAAARAMAPEVGGHGIRVNAVAPGTIDTPMLRRDLSGMNREETDAFVERVERANALGRIGRPEEVAEVPGNVATVGDLVRWLKNQGGEYEYAFENEGVVRAAIDHVHVKPDTAIAGAREIAFFPPMTGG
jgi:NAD(P)-dependent dehydrogenase (short-subunit alcohol dehydrogenase family)